MMGLLAALILIISIVLCVLAIVYGVECLMGSLPATHPKAVQMRRPALTILIPAHNEEAGIVATLQSVRAQMRDDDALLVVADNCDDDTAERARGAGADVLERFDDTLRSKGYALDFGIQHLRQNPPPYVVLIDADCNLEPAALDELANAVATSGRPVQACYLMSAPPEAPVDLSVAEFAFLVKNRVRPLGLARLGLPCQLTGSGMAFPWALLEKVDLAHSNIVEDMKLGLDLAAMGHPPMFCEKAIVTSQFPYSSTGLASQRQRWEEGHVAMIKAKIGNLFNPQILRDPASLALTIDVLVPPLTLLAFAVFAVLGAGIVLALFGIATWPLMISAFSTLLIGAATSAAWLAHGSSVLPAETLRKIPAYMWGKLKLYPRTLLGKGDGRWTRTDRNKLP